MLLPSHLLKIHLNIILPSTSPVSFPCFSALPVYKKDWSVGEIQFVIFFRELGVQCQDRDSSVSGATTRIWLVTGFRGWDRASFASDVTNPVSYITIQVRKDVAHYSWTILSTYTCDWIVSSNVAGAILRRTQCALHYRMSDVGPSYFQDA